MQSRIFNIQLLRGSIAGEVSITGSFSNPSNGWNHRLWDVITKSNESLVRGKCAHLLNAASQNAGQLDTPTTHQDVTAQIKIGDNSITLQFVVTHNTEIDDEIIKGILLNHTLPNAYDQLMYMIGLTLGNHFQKEKVQLFVNGKPHKATRLVCKNYPLFKNVPEIRRSVPA